MAGFLQIINISAIAELRHQAGALLAVDNTFTSPYLQQSITLGADLVVHSTTKYFGSHSDMVGGAEIGRKELLQPPRVCTRTRTCGPLSAIAIRDAKVFATMEKEGVPERAVRRM